MGRDDDGDRRRGGGSVILLMFYRVNPTGIALNGQDQSAVHTTARPVQGQCRGDERFRLTPGASRVGHVE